MVLQGCEFNTCKYIHSYFDGPKHRFQMVSSWCFLEGFFWNRSEGTSCFTHFVRSLPEQMNIHALWVSLILFAEARCAKVSSRHHWFRVCFGLSFSPWSSQLVVHLSDSASDCWHLSKHVIKERGLIWTGCTPVERFLEDISIISIHFYSFLVFDRQVERNVISYNTAMSSCEKSSCWEIVLSLLQSLKSVDAPNEISCAAALTACGKGQKWQLALQIFHSIASWHETINLSTYQLHSIFKSHFEGTRSDVNFRTRPRPVLTAYAAELHLRWQCFDAWFCHLQLAGCQMSPTITIYENKNLEIRYMTYTILCILYESHIHIRHERQTAANTCTTRRLRLQRCHQRVWNWWPFLVDDPGLAR